MNQQQKNKLSIIAIGWYTIGSAWLARYIYLNHVPEGYETTFIISGFLYFCMIYLLVTYHFVEK